MTVLQSIQCDWCFCMIRGKGLTMSFLPNKNKPGEFIYDPKKSVPSLRYTGYEDEGLITKHMCDDCVESIMELDDKIRREG